MIDHIFVVMLENRSFDHMLGFSQNQGIDPSGKPTKIEWLTGKESNISLSGDLVNARTYVAQPLLRTRCLLWRFGR
jgi:phospholipase C